MRVSSGRIARWSSSALSGATMHKVDERVEVDHIRQLKRIYGRVLADYFAG
jgi:acetylornithine deacetylase/succinyl-diaminopimelate desuccinylase-like protein